MYPQILSNIKMSTFATLNQGSTGINLIKEEKETNGVKIGEKKEWK